MGFTATVPTGALHLYSDASHGKHRARGNITEHSGKSRTYVILEFRGFFVLFRDVSACSVFSVGGNTINDEGGLARDE